MSYYEFYSKNTSKCAETVKGSTRPKNVLPNRKKPNISKTNGIETSETSEVITGTCLSMCPEEEVLMRVKAKMVHILEIIDGKRVLVKCYSRSAADSLVAVPRLLRPYRVLQDTVWHLLLRVVQREDTSLSVIYDFVCDRLRAVRQDMTVQRLSAAECITLLEPMIRFHVYFGYKLCEYPISVYDPVLNRKLLLECLKWFLSCCDSLTPSSPSDPVGDQNASVSSDISMTLLNLTLYDSDNTQSESFLNCDEDDTKCDRALMESLYILCNLDDVHPMYRYWSLPKNFKSNSTIKLAYEIAVANMRGNYVQVCQQLENLCPLTYCALCLHLPTLQRHALQVMSAAYNSKQLTVPLRAIRRWLRFDSDSEAARVCAHYGLVNKGDALPFVRGDCKADVATHQPTRLLAQEKMDLSSKHVFTYLSKDYAYTI